MFVLRRFGKGNVFQAGINKGIKTFLFMIGKFWFIPIKPLRSQYDIVFIFKSYDLSGAPRVHLDVVSVFKEKRLLIIFTKKFSNKGLLDKFSLMGETFIIKNKYIKHFYLGMISVSMKRYIPYYLFGQGTPDFYCVIKDINEKKVRIIDINHAICGIIQLPDNLIRKLYKRIIIDKATEKYLLDYHRLMGAPADNICLIGNKTDIPDYTEKSEKTRLSIVYVGRDTSEKRAYLLPLIAQGLRNKIDFELTMIGKFKESFKRDNCSDLSFIGEVSDKSILNQYYKNADIILLVSSREGFPMVLMEAMAYGVVPVCTPAGGIPFHIKSGVNGFLIDRVEESDIIETTIEIIIRLYNDRTLLRNVSINAYNYAKENFGAKRFDDEYKKLIKL